MSSHTTHPNTGFTFTPSRGSSTLRDVLDEVDRQFHLWRAITDSSSTIEPDENGVYSTAIELPGYKREEVAMEASAEEGLITITASNSKRGKSTHSFYLDGLDPEKVAAKLEDGILTVSVERVARAKARKIEVTS